MSSKAQILVVDDDGPIVILMRSLLREFGFEPVTATTGAEALQRARQAHPDLVLVDKNMPGMSGEELVRAMRAERHLAAVPILMLSGEPMTREELDRIGANDSVEKPFDVMKLVEEIRARVGRGGMRSEPDTLDGEIERRAQPRD